MIAKPALLEKETRCCEELKKAKTNLKTELAAFCEEMEKAKVDTVAGFRTSQPYYDEYGVYYGNRSNDCLKQVASVYPDLDLSQVVIDDTVPPTPGDVGAAINEVDDFVHTVKEDGRSLMLRQSTNLLLKGQPLMTILPLLRVHLPLMALLLRTNLPSMSFPPSFFFSICCFYVYLVNL